MSCRDCPAKQCANPPLVLAGAPSGASLAKGGITLGLLGQLNGSMIPVNQRFTPYYLRVTVEATYFHAIVTQVHVIHLVPIEVCYELQFRFTGLNAIDWIVPVSRLSWRPRIINHDGCVARRHDAEKRDCLLKNILHRPLSLGFPQHQFGEQNPLYFIELIN